MHIRTIFLIALGMAGSACTLPWQSHASGGGCAASADLSRLVMSLAVATLVDSTRSPGPVARALAGPPFQAESLRARARVVTDDRVCRAAGASAQEWPSHDAYEVVQIGRTYWVRGTSWAYTNLIDDQFRPVTSFIDQ